MEDAAVDQRGRDFFIGVASIPADEMPAATWEELVGAWDGGLPVLLFEVAVTITLLEPVDWAEDSACAEEEIWGHSETESNEC